MSATVGRPPRPEPDEREMDLLAWLAGGATVSLIAKEMEMSEPAVKTAIRVLRLRVGALTAAHLVSIAHIKGWLDTPCKRPHVEPVAERCKGRIEGRGTTWNCSHFAGHQGDHRNHKLDMLNDRSDADDDYRERYRDAEILGGDR